MKDQRRSKKQQKKSRAEEGEGLCCTKKDGDAEDRGEPERPERKEFNHAPSNKMFS